MIVLDASVVIGLLRPEDALHGRAVRFFSTHVDYELALHALTQAEVLVGPSKNGTAAIVTARLSSLDIRTIPLNASDVIPLANLRAKTGLKIPDACVVLAATTLDASLATFDERLRSGAAGVGVQVLPVE